jgi:hypothetical protein
MKIDAEAFEEFDQGVGAFSQDWARLHAFGIQPVIGNDVDGLRAGAVAHDVQEAVCFRLGE